MAHTERVVILVDMDCFYCQVEEKLDPRIRGKPIAVVQYNAWQGGGIIAVNYPARDRGVTRHMRGNEAKKKCPDIELVRVPNVRGKADLTKYREAGKRVAEVLQKFTPLLERASVDEAYLDVTEAVNERLKFGPRIGSEQLQSTHIVGYGGVADYLNHIYDNEYLTESNVKLAWGGVIAEEIRAAVYATTGYRCSAGVAHNKILAKLVCGLHKPNKQTILPQEEVPTLYESLPVRKITGLGGKFGNQLSEKLSIQNMGELYQFSEKELNKCFDEKTAIWLYKIARGIDTEPVTVRLVSKSIGCCKKFPGRTALLDHDSVKHWLDELSVEIVERLEQDLEENNRRAKQMVISFSQEVNRKDVASSRTHPLNGYDPKKIMHDAYELIKKHCLRPDDSFRIKFLGLSVGKFEDNKAVNEISSYFKRSETVSVADVEDESEESRDSISGELACDVSADNVGSFFQTYLQKLPNPTSRDFNTSLILEEAIDDVLTEETGDDDQESSVPEETPVESPTVPEETCPECGKNVSESEFVVHMDHHFVVKMVRDEADLYRPKISENTKKVIPQKKTKNGASPKKSTKRKLSNCQKLTSFLVPKISDDVVTEICDECKRRVPVDEFESHVDYHVAKKLHMELNPVVNKENTSDNNSDRKRSTKIGTGKIVKDHKTPSVASYFKHI